MQNGQPPSWRPDHNQAKVGVYRGTVRDALGGLRNLEQLLGSLRVGPRALLSVIPDVRSCCTPLREAIYGLSENVALKLVDAGEVLRRLSAAADARLVRLSDVLDSIGKSTFNARARLRLEEQIVLTRTEIEAIFELVELLAEAAWGRLVPINLAEVAREAFRSSEPPGSTKSAVRLTLYLDIPPVERDAIPQALVLLLNLLIRLAVHSRPELMPRVVFEQSEGATVTVTVRNETSSGELRWAKGRLCLPETEACMRIAAHAMNVRLDLGPDGTTPRLMFAAS